MTNGIERSRYPEFTRFLNSYGVSHKNKDGMACPKCFTPIIPSSGGVPDYTWFINGYGVVVEMKGGKDRVAFSQIDDKQREHLDWWEQKSGGMAWIAVTVGEGRVNSKDDDRKRFWLVDWSTWKYMEKVIIDQEGVRYIPVNPVGRFKDPLLTLSAFHNCELEWVDGGWGLPLHHKLREYYGLLTQVTVSIKEEAQKELTNARTSN